jgi:peroxin-10
MTTKNYSHNFPSIEYILRSIEKDEQYCNNISRGLIKILESLSNFVSINFSSLSDKIEFISNFVFYFCCYFLRKRIITENIVINNTPGEEYSKIRKSFESRNSLSILSYVFSYSIKNIFIKYLYNILHSTIEKSLHQNFFEKDQNILNTFFFKFKTIFNRMSIKIFADFPTFEKIIEKIEEIQFCYFFINGKFYDFIQRIFCFNYEKISTEINLKDDIQISSEGFKYFGYLMGLKLLTEFFVKMRNVFKIYKTEKENLMKEITKIENKKKLNSLQDGELNYGELEENLLKFNLKSKNTLTQNKLSQQLHNAQDEETSCLLCLEHRSNTSSTPCGHLFCWSCLVNYLQSNDSCPFCRQRCHTNEVILLQNLK